MVSFTLDAVKFLLIYRYLQNTYWFKRGASLSLVPRVEALASPNLSKRATPKAPRQCKYIISPSIPTNVKYIRRQRGRYTIHPIERSRCFVFDKLCRELPDSYTSKPKRTVTPYYVYVCPTSAHRGFRYG